jgi:hypothetical protein
MAEPSAFPLLWRARIEVLRALAITAKSKPLRRQRLLDLAGSLELTAGQHPLSASYSVQGSLLPIHRMMETAPEWVFRVVLAEVASMKIDAPYETGVNKTFSDRAEGIALISGDADLREAGTAIVRVAKRFREARSWPKWQDMPCVGGAKGTIQVRQSEFGNDIEILMGHDPAGWLGFDFAAGRWLLAGYEPMQDDKFGTPPSPDARGDATPPPGVQAATSGGLLGAATVGGAMIGLLLPVAGLGPVLGGAAIAAAAASASRKRKRKSGREAETAPRVPESAEARDSLIARLSPTVTIGAAFGRGWVRAEACKLVSLYGCLPDAAAGDPDAGLPPARQASLHMNGLWIAASQMAEDEKAESGEPDHDVNRPLWDLADIADTVRKAGEMLEEMSKKPRR